MKNLTGWRMLVAQKTQLTILTKVLLIAFFVSVLTGCDIATIFGPVVAKYGEEVTYQLLISESRELSNVTMYITTDVPSGWTSVDTFFHASMDGVYPATAVVHPTDPGVITGLPAVPSGYQRLYFSAGPFPATTGSETGTGVFRFLATSVPGTFDLTFWAGYTSDSLSDFGDPATISVEVLPAPPADSLFVDGFEYGDTTAWAGIAGPDPALAAYYPLDGTGIDSSGNGNHGTLIGGPTGTADRFGTPGAAMLFDGIDDYVQIADSDSLDLETGICLAAWIHPSTTSQTYVIQKADLTGGGMVYNLDIYPETLRAGFHGVPSGGWAQGYSLIRQDEWYHLMFMSDGTSTHAFVNGVLEDFSSHDPTSIEVGDGAVSIGAYVGTRFYGVIDEVVVMERSLTPREVSRLAQ